RPRSRRDRCPPASSTAPARPLVVCPQHPSWPPAHYGAGVPADRHLAHLRAPDVARCLSARSIVVQPLGAIEQHGPHLPFNTDLLVAERVAEAAVARVGEELDVWLLPPLAYTKSNEHAWSPGTVWLSASTLLAVLDDLGRCIAMTPAKRLVFLNGPGGNSALVGVANRALRLHHRLMTVLAPPRLPAGP